MIKIRSQTDRKRQQRTTQMSIAAHEKLQKNEPTNLTSL